MTVIQPKGPEVFKDHRYREGVGILLLNDKREIFVGKRSSQSILIQEGVLGGAPLEGASGVWQMPQGGVDCGEAIAEAALRELREETGVTTVEILGISKEWYYYDFPIQVVPYIWGGKYLGQKQKWVMMQFEGALSEFDLSSHEEKEFDEWKWDSPISILENVIDFKAELYKKVFEEFCFI